MKNFNEFKSACVENKLIAKDCGGGHWRILGGTRNVSWWPTSKKRTAFVNRSGDHEGRTVYFVDDKMVISIARYGKANVSIKIPKKKQPESKPKNNPKRKRKNNRSKKLELLAGDPYCYLCKCEVTDRIASIDHWIPLASGGSNKLSNLRLSCLNCNADKADTLPENYKPINVAKPKKSVMDIIKGVFK